MKKETIEIPFGAKDSELVEATYFIPEGMEAIIDGDKVIIRKKKSEDEKISEWIKDGLKFYSDAIGDEQGLQKAIAWLEKQGEQKPTDLGTWKCIVDAVVSEREGEAVEGIIDGDNFIIRKKEGIGQNIDSPWVTEVAAKLQKRFGSIKQKPVEYAKGEDHGVDGLWTALDILQKTLGEVKGYQSDDGILEHECAISAVEKLYYEEPIDFDLTD